MIPRSQLQIEPRRLAKLLASVAVSGLCVVYGLEVGLRLLAALQSPPEGPSIEARRRKEEDAPQKQALLQAGLSPLFYPEMVRSNSASRGLAHRHGFVPLAPQPATKLVYCNEGYGMVTYQTDHLGFRNPPAVWDMPTDILLVGDSFAHGSCVPDDEVLSAHLSDLGHAVINVATGGNDPIIYASLIKTFARPTPRAVVVVVYTGNDFEPISRTDVFGSAYLGDDARDPGYIETATTGRFALSATATQFYQKLEKVLKARSDKYLQWLATKPPDPPPPSLAKRAKAAVKLKMLREAVHAYLTTPAPEPFDAMQGAGIMLDLLLGSCNRNKNCTPVVVTISPSPFWMPHKQVQALEAQFAELVASRQRAHSELVFVDSSPTITALGMNGNSPKGHHLSKTGYREVAQLINAALQSASHQ